MLTGCPSADSSLVAARPSLQNGTLTTMCSCSVRRARPSATMPRASAETTSAEVGPSTSSQMRRMLSPGSPSALASSDGLVVAPESTPQAASSSTSATSPVSMKSVMQLTLPVLPDQFERIDAGIDIWHFGITAQHLADRQGGGDLGHVMDAHDRHAGVGGPQRGSHRRSEAPVRRPAGD